MNKNMGLCLYIKDHAKPNLNTTNHNVKYPTHTTNIIHAKTKSWPL